MGHRGYIVHKNLGICWVFVQSRRVHLFIVNCLLKHKFNTQCNILFIYLSQHYKPNFHGKNIIRLKFTITTRYSSLIIIDIVLHAPSLTVVMLCVCTKRVCVCNNEQSHFPSLYSNSLVNMRSLHDF